MSLHVTHSIPPSGQGGQAMPNFKQWTTEDIMIYLDPYHT